MVKREVRFGAEIRKRESAVLEQKRARYVCKSCKRKKVKRVGNSIWKCMACKAVFAGGAYAYETPIGAAARRLVEGA